MVVDQNRVCSTAHEDNAAAMMAKTFSRITKRDSEYKISSRFTETTSRQPRPQELFVAHQMVRSLRKLRRSISEQNPEDRMVKQKPDQGDGSSMKRLKSYEPPDAAIIVESGKSIIVLGKRRVDVEGLA